MPEGPEIVLRVAVVGIGATVVLDLWNAFLKRAFGILSLDMAMLGRWFGHFPHGRFVHEHIAKAARIPGERIIGWSAHYAIGIAWAALLLAIWGLDWARHPTPLPALIVGLATVIAPFFMMQPAMGLGLAASKTPRPAIARLKSIASHAVYGVGLYVFALLSSALVP